MTRREQKLALPEKACKYASLCLSMQVCVSMQVCISYNTDKEMDSLCTGCGYDGFKLFCIVY